MLQNNLKDMTKTEEFPNVQNWDDFDISPNLLRGIHGCGYENPSPIQQKAIQPILSGRDVVAQAQSGTGKTAAFSIGALSKVEIELFKTQVLILSPTKELSTQTANVVTSLGNKMNGLLVETAFGGQGHEPIQKLGQNQGQKSGNMFLTKTCPHIICGCPGKVLDMLRRNKILPRYLKLIVIDEVDEMLSSGFKDQLYYIFQFIGESIQIALFSATMPPSIDSIVNKIVKNPVKILVESERLTLDGIQQFFVPIQDDEEKYESLKNIFLYLSVSQCIIYCNGVNRVEDLYEAMSFDKYPVCRIHRNMSKEQRHESFMDFKNGKSRVLISTNITSRGIDIQQVSVVINFDVPSCVDSYLHRIGRSGRWGRKGVGINFITERDVDHLRNVEKHYKCDIKQLPSELNFLNSY